MWKDVENFGTYQISDKGEIRRKQYEVTDTAGHCYTLPERMLKPWVSKNGYLLVTLMKDRKRYAKYIHILVAEHFLPPETRKATVNHKDGNKQNCTVKNLEYATYSENNQHAYDTNLKGKGSLFYNAKLTEEQVRCIREQGKYATYQEIADRYHVTKATIRDVLIGKTWKSVS